MANQSFENCKTVVGVGKTSKSSANLENCYLEISAFAYFGSCCLVQPGMPENGVVYSLLFQKGGNGSGGTFFITVSEDISWFIKIELKQIYFINTKKAFKKLYMLYFETFRIILNPSSVRK